MINDFERYKFEFAPLPRSIRKMELGSAERLDEGGDTFNDMLSIHLNQPISSLSISNYLPRFSSSSAETIITGPANRDVALGARKGLYIVDLNNPFVECIFEGKRFQLTPTLQIRDAKIPAALQSVGGGGRAVVSLGRYLHRFSTFPSFANFLVSARSEWVISTVGPSF